jgi:transposase
MAGKRKTMEQIRNIIQQKVKGSSIRSIASHTGLSRNTVRSYLRVIESKGYELSQVLKMDDQALAELLEQDGSTNKDSRFLQLQSKLQGYASELKKRHVTRQLLWEEYRQAFPDGYGYTRFCHHLNEHIGSKDVTATFTHVPGEKLMVDFAGDKLSYIDRQSGEVVNCEVFVAVLPFSSFIYVEAPASQNLH